MYKVSWDEENKVMRGYIVGYHQHIPAEAITISQKEFAEYSKQPQNYRLIEGVLTYREPIEETLEQLKQITLEQLEKQAQVAYIGGFVSEASGKQVTYDSTEDDQRTFTILYNASQSPDFESDPDYQGRIPVRGVPEGSEAKETYYLTKEQFQKLNDDLARHLGTVKLKHWTLQAEVNKAKTKRKLQSIKWE